MTRYSTLIAALAAGLLSACAGAQRHDEPPCAREPRLRCCCQHPTHTCAADCRALSPDDLDDFGPHRARVRIARRDQWLPLEQFAELCPH